MRTDERSDTDLVAAALAGERQAVADIYDRYSTVVFTVCVRLIGNRDEAADCAADVFLRATERLHQLRDPEKLKPWLYAIARNEVARRQRQRGREVLVEAIDDLPWLASDDPGFDLALDVRAPELVGAAAPPGGGRTSGDPDARAALGSAGAIEQLLQEASAGLTDRDRAVAELGLRQNLQGDELAAALGVTTNHAYVLVHRVRGRLEKAVTAILVARTGREDCPELAKVLAGWDGDLTVLLRKRVARHIDRCEICGTRRKAVPAALFDAAPVLAAPIAIRQKVLADAQVGTATGRPWSRSGFPDGGSGHRRALWLTGAAAILLVIAMLALLATARADDATVLAERSSVDTTVSEPDDGPGTSVATAPGTTTATTPTDSTPASTDPTASTTSPTTSIPGGGQDPGGHPVVTDPTDGDIELPPVAGSLIANPTAVDFGPTSTAQGLVLTNTGETELTFSLTPSSPQVGVIPSGGSVAPGASQVIGITLDRNGLGDGAFASVLDGQAGGSPVSIPVSGTNSQAPRIVSVDGPAQFGAVVSANPGCDVVVVATDNSAVVGVKVVFDNPSTPANPADVTTDLALSGGSWRGQLLVPAAAVITGTWHVVVRDAVGNETRSPGMTATTGSICLP